MDMSATIKRYEIHNKLLNLWVKLFPDVACDQVDKVGVNSYELNDSVLYCTLTYHDGRINATKGTRTILKIDTNKFPISF